MRAYFVSEKHMELDIHGFTVDEAKKYLVFSPMKNVNKLTVLPVRKLMDIMTITS